MVHECLGEAKQEPHWLRTPFIFVIERQDRGGSLGSQRKKESRKPTRGEI